MRFYFTPADPADQSGTNADIQNLKYTDQRKSACLLICEISEKNTIQFPADGADGVPADNADQFGTNAET